MLQVVSALNQERGLVAGSTLVLAILLTVLGYDWARRTASPYPLVGTIEPEGTVKVRRSRTLFWSTVTDGARLRLWDTISTGPTSKATVYLEVQDLDRRVKIRLGPDTLARFRVTGDYGAELSVEQGQVESADVEALRLIRIEAPMEFLARKGTAQSRWLPDPPDSTEFYRASDRARQVMMRPVPPEPIQLSTITPPPLDDPEYFVLQLLSPTRSSPMSREAPGHTVIAGNYVSIRWTPIPLRDVEYDVKIESMSEPGLETEYRADRARLEIEPVNPGQYRCMVTAKRFGDVIYSVAFTLTVTPRGGFGRPSVAPRRGISSPPRRGAPPPGRAPAPRRR